MPNYGYGLKDKAWVWAEGQGMGMLGSVQTPPLVNLGKAMPAPINFKGRPDLVLHFMMIVIVVLITSWGPSPEEHQPG